MRENELIHIRLEIESYTHAARHLYLPVAYHHFVSLTSWPIDIGLNHRGGLSSLTRLTRQVDMAEMLRSEAR